MDIKNFFKKLAAKFESYSFVRRIVFFAVLWIFLTGICIGARAAVLYATVEAVPLTDEQSCVLEKTLDENYPVMRSTIRPLPYKTIPARLDLNCGSAILISQETGNILYEKNADQLIPPASMIKTFLMYCVFEKVADGTVSFDDVVPVNENHWASRMPPHSSLMFLGKNHTVTLDELLGGISISSGNDASHAVCDFLFGGNDKYIEYINAKVKELGLEKTIVVESSGYSEENLTTARDMVTFGKLYLERFPESLKYHSLPKIVYPQKHNLPEDQRDLPAQDLSHGFPDDFWSAIEQPNTNGLLKTLEGCDGVKTGHINESGYNLMLTCKRGNDRYLSVQMLGPGNGLAEGDALRKNDGKTLMNFAFDTFASYTVNQESLCRFVKLFGCKEDGIILCPAYNCDVSIPKLNGDDDIVSKVEVVLELPEYIYGPVEAGKPYGKAIFKIGEILIQEVPLVADRTVDKSSPIKRAADSFIKLFYNK